MEIRDGFILGIYNYCDRWCERCPFTNRCRVFADLAEIEFEEGNGPLTEGTRSRERRRQASLAEFGCSEEKVALDHSSSMSQDDMDRLFANLEVSIGPDPEVVAGGDALRERLRALEHSKNPTVRDAIATIRHFTLFVPLKLMRAVSQVAQGERGGPQSDAHGSGKAALLGLERMTLAWQALVGADCLSDGEVAPFLNEIAGMRRNLDRVLPDARAFVRPGFDELDEVARIAD